MVLSYWESTIFAVRHRFEFADLFALLHAPLSHVACLQAGSSPVLSWLGGPFKGQFIASEWNECGSLFASPQPPVCLPACSVHPRRAADAGTSGGGARHVASRESAVSEERGPWAVNQGKSISFHTCCRHGGVFSCCVFTRGRGREGWAWAWQGCRPGRLLPGERAGKKALWRTPSRSVHTRT